MIRVLTSRRNTLVTNENITGATQLLSGVFSPDAYGDASRLTGVVNPGLTGCITGLRGDVTGLFGNATDLSGNLNLAGIKIEERVSGFNIEGLII